MVFSLDRFFENDPRDERVETLIGEEIFLIRPLNGLECLEYEEKKRKGERILFLLVHGLADQDIDRRLSEEEGRRLLAEHEPLAAELAARILELTTAVYAEEKRRWKLAKKRGESPYERLRRAYCRKYRIPPAAVISKAELIEDAAAEQCGCREIELNGIPDKLFFNRLKENFCGLR